MEGVVKNPKSSSNAVELARKTLEQGTDIALILAGVSLNTPGINSVSKGNHPIVEDEGDCCGGS